MARMVRKQVYIEAVQEKSLKDMSRRLGLSEAELIRRALDDGLARGALRRNSLHPFEADVWARERRVIQRLLSHEGRARRRKWTREELYEERLSRYGRH